MRWLISHRADPPAVAIADRHYNRQKPGSPQFVPPGRCLVLLSDCGKAVWVTSYPYAEHVKHAWGGAWVNSIFRNEGAVLSSELIRQAVAATRAYWPEAPALGMITFIDADKTRRKRDPGRCYRKAGFRLAGRTKGGLYALQMLPHEMPAPQSALPKRHKMTLAPVQLEAITRADGRRGYAYFMEMGLGKTLTVLTEFKTLRMCNAVERLVVICPNSFKGGWKNEIEKHRTGLSAIIYESGRTRRPTDEDVLIINYEAARTKAGLEVIFKFIEDKSCYLALDESIKLKNRLSQQTKAIIGSMYKQEMRGGITMFFDYIRLLSGKPMSQGPHDLWAQMMAINEMGMTYYGFQNRYCHLGGWMNKEVTGSQNEAELQEKLSKVSFQAKKKDWLTGLPPKVYSIRRHTLGDALQKHYDEMEEEFLTYLQGETVTVAVAIAKYEKLCTDTVRLPDQRDGRAARACAARQEPALAASPGDH